jgi:hypothetical protein
MQLIRLIQVYHEAAKEAAIKPDPVSGCRECPKCGAPSSQLALDCREFSSGAAGLITCTCKKCGHTSAAY